MEVEKKKPVSPEKILEEMIADEPDEKPFGIVIPLEDSSMILKSSKFSIMESYPDLKNAEPTFTLRISLEEKDVSVFEKLEKKLADIAMKNQKKVQALAAEAKSEDPDVDFKSAAKYDAKSFKLIRENGEVWGRLYHEPKELKVTTRFWRLIGRKRRKIEIPNTLIDSELEGRIVLQLKQIFMAKHKAITCVVREVLVEKEHKPVSAFDEFSEEEEES